MVKKFFTSCDGMCISQWSLFGMESRHPNIDGKKGVNFNLFIPEDSKTQSSFIIVSSFNNYE